MSNNKHYGKKPWFKKKASFNSELSANAYYFVITPCHNYTGFQLYFKDTTEEISKIIKCTKAFQSYIEDNMNLFPISKIREAKSFTIDTKTLLIDAQFVSDWPEFNTDLPINPEFCINCLSLAMHQFIDDQFDDPNSTTLKSIIHCRLTNFDPIQNLKNIRVNSYSKLVAIRGTVIRTSILRSVCEQLAFKCVVCGGTQMIRQIDGAFTLPTKCLTKECKNRSNFTPAFESDYTRTVQSQILKLQELIGDEQYENGRIPRTIECELKNDLVGCCVPGDDIIVIGIIKGRNINENCSKQKSSTFLLYLEANSIVNEKTGSDQTNHKRTNCRITFNTTDYYAIKKIHSEPDLFRLLVHSLCPHIYGHELVKAGLLLALMGGTGPKDRPSGQRSDSHVLMVGDPGLGKSQLLQACCNAAPRGVYVCGNVSTTAGLTVTMTKDGGNGEHALEAGALVLADEGCCCIDEFDKMIAQHSCLLEVMEQQCISIAKAGVICSLPTRSTILAAANPVGGHYNKAKSVAENLKMSSPLLSRFDLVFILLDQPNEELDLLLSEHIIALHTGSDEKSDGHTSILNKSFADKKSLKDRLKIRAGDKNLVPIPHQLLRKYIAYAQKYVHPKLDHESKQILKDFYLEIRRNHHKEDSTPITTRQLESMIRLTQARARLELREEGCVQDALDVVEIMRHSLVDIYSDGLGALDFGRSQMGSGISNSKIVGKFLQLLQRKSRTLDRSVLHIDQFKDIAHNFGIDDRQLYEIIDKLNMQNLLLKKGSGNFELIT